MPGGACSAWARSTMSGAFISIAREGQVLLV